MTNCRYILSASRPDHYVSWWENRVPSDDKCALYRLRFISKLGLGNGERTHSGIVVPHGRAADLVPNSHCMGQVSFSAQEGPHIFLNFGNLWQRSLA